MIGPPLAGACLHATVATKVAPTNRPGEILIQRSEVCPADHYSNPSSCLNSSPLITVTPSFSASTRFAPALSPTTT